MSSYASNVVPKECEGMRLDAYMASQGLYPTRSAAAKCIADGYCALNGKLPRKSASVCAGDVLEYETYEDPHAPIFRSTFAMKMTTCSLSRNRRDWCAIPRRAITATRS